MPYLLGLSRTTPLFGVLGGVIAVAAFERSLDGAPVDMWLRRMTPGFVTARLRWQTRWLSIAALCTLTGLALVAGRSHPHAAKLVYLTPVAVGALGWMRARHGRPLTTVGALAGAAALVCLGWSAVHDRRAAPLGSREAALFAWIQESTPGTALFVVPPGMDTFRYYARRSIYVDLKLFSPAVPRVVPLWRTRLDEVADPDPATLRHRGWPDIEVHWDRRYAARNTPERIAWLLRHTGAEYFVSRSGLPDAAPLWDKALASADFAVAFHNDRYDVYRLATGR